MKNLILPFFCLLFCLFFWTSCDLEDPIAGIRTAEVISLRASQSELSADGVARLVLTAELLEKADPNLDITFTTEAGFFPIGGSGAQQVTLTASGRTAELILQSDNENTGLIAVSASINNYSAPLNIEFQRAEVDDIIAVTDRAAVAADRVDFAQITTQLFKDEGSPTIGTRVDYEVIELDTATATIVPFDFVDQSLQSIVNVKSANGKPGKIQIKISTEGEAEEQLLDIEFVQ